MKRKRIEVWAVYRGQMAVTNEYDSLAELKHDVWSTMRGDERVVHLVEHSPTAREEADALRAALAWWRAQRPLGRTEDEHIRNPAVNTTTVREKALAKSMARLQAARKRATK